MNALLMIDIQNDFCPGGALEVPNGDEIIPAVNRLTTRFDHVLQSQDWHPEGHHSFATSHSGKSPFETITTGYGEQVLWPDHCIQGQAGAEFHPDLNTEKTEVIIRKGFRKEIDSYSAFYENDHETKTGLTGYLRDRGIRHLVVCGLATDFCVKWSVLDGLKEGFQVTVVRDAIRGIDIDGSVDAAFKEMKQSGAEFVQSDTFS